MSNMITMSQEAQQQLRSVLERQNKPHAGLRVFISPGGCSGFSYGMNLEEEFDPSDTVIDYGGVKVVIDEFSVPYLMGSQIDYEDSLMGGGFQVRNPNASKSCSCGQSFDAVQGGGQPKTCSR